jgi:hypothetical protein
MHTPESQSDPLASRPEVERAHADAPAPAALSTTTAPLMLDGSGRICADDCLNYPEGEDSRSSVLNSSAITSRLRRKRPWSKKHHTCKRLIQWLLLYWMHAGKQCQFLTLTSSPDSTRKDLRRNMRIFFWRIERYLEWARGSIKYRCVDTDEGCGVLHIVLAIPIAPGAFWIDYGLLREWWVELHAANQFFTKEIKHGRVDAERLSVYIVSQYIGDQDLTVRMSGTRLPLNFTAVNKQLWRIVNNRPVCRLNDEGGFTDELIRPFNPDFEVLRKRFMGVMHRRCRAAMSELLLSGSTVVDGVSYVLDGSSVIEV